MALFLPPDSHRDAETVTTVPAVALAKAGLITFIVRVIAGFLKSSNLAFSHKAVVQVLFICKIIILVQSVFGK